MMRLSQQMLCKVSRPAIPAMKTRTGGWAVAPTEKANVLAGAFSANWNTPQLEHNIFSDFVEYSGLERQCLPIRSRLVISPNPRINQNVPPTKLASDIFSNLSSFVLPAQRVLRVSLRGELRSAIYADQGWEVGGVRNRGEQKGGLG